MEEEVQRRLERLEQKLDAIYVSAEKTRKYFLAVLIVSIVVFIVPLIGLIFAVPGYISTYSELMGGL